MHVFSKICKDKNATATCLLSLFVAFRTICHKVQTGKAYAYTKNTLLLQLSPKTVHIFNKICIRVSENKWRKVK